MYSKLWSDQSTSNKIHNIPIFFPSNVLGYCFWRLRCLFSMLTESLSCELYCHSITGFMPLAIASSSHQTQVCLGWSTWACSIHCFNSPFINGVQHLSFKVFNQYIRSGVYSTQHWPSQRNEMQHPQQAELQYFTPGLTPIHKITLGKPCQSSSPEFSQLLDMDNNVLWSLSKSFDKGQRF